MEVPKIAIGAIKTNILKKASTFYFCQKEKKILQIATKLLYEKKNYARRRYERIVLLKKPFTTSVSCIAGRTNSIAAARTYVVAPKGVGCRNNRFNGFRDPHETSTTQICLLQMPSYKLHVSADIHTYKLTPSDRLPDISTGLSPINKISIRKGRTRRFKNTDL